MTSRNAERFLIGPETAIAEAACTPYFERPVDELNLQSVHVDAHLVPYQRRNRQRQRSGQNQCDRKARIGIELKDAQRPHLRESLQEMLPPASKNR